LKPAPFEYRRPDGLEEALELMARHGDEARPLAGGQSLIPLLAMRLARPAVLIDLARVPELRGVEVAGDRVWIGAMVREAELERAEGLPEVVVAALPHIGHFQIRSRGTAGGSLAHADPAAEWPALAALLDARIELASSRGRRHVAGTELALAPLTTCLAPDELLCGIELHGAGGSFGFREVERRHGDFALAGAAAHRGRVVAFATGGAPQRLAGCETFISQGGEPGPELRAIAHDEIEAVGDVHAGAAYRRRVGARLVELAVAACG
jgi:CO/xanthine dehydrogenase FAD-binding subunit